MPISLWKNQSSDFKLGDHCASGVLDLVDSPKGLDSRAPKLEIGISIIFEFSRRYDQFTLKKPELEWDFGRFLRLRGTNFSVLIG
jgi:hypothetical protein